MQWLRNLKNWARGLLARLYVRQLRIWHRIQLRQFRRSSRSSNLWPDSTVENRHSTIVGFVEAGGEPVTGARVLGHWSMLECEEAFTDEAGEFIVRRVPEGRSTWSVAVDGWAFGSVELLAADAPGGPKPIEEPHDRIILRMVPGGAIAGGVLWPDGTPVADTKVSVMGTEPELDLHFHEDVVTGDDGRFRFEDLAPGEYSVFGEHPTWSGESGLPIDVSIDEIEAKPQGCRAHSAGIVVTAGQVSEVQIVLEVVSGDHTLEGTVVDRKGQPVPEATVMVFCTNSWCTRTDALGTFVVRGLPNGEPVMILASAAGHGRCMSDFIEPGDPPPIITLGPGRIRLGPRVRRAIREER